MAETREKKIEQVLQQMEDLPTLPSVAVRVLELTGDQKASARPIAELIQSDPALSLRILQLVRRADMGVSGEVTSVGKAVVLLGFDAVRSAVLAASVFDTFGARSPVENSHFKREDFWRHCLATACCAELMAETTAGKINPSDAFVCGLLHDIGKIAFDAQMPKSFARVVQANDLLRGNIAEVERHVIGMDHMLVGKRLAEKWRLPQIIRDCIWLHGQDPATLAATALRDARMVNLITLADQVVREQHIGYSGNYNGGPARAELVAAVGITDDAVNFAMERLVTRLEPRAQWLGLGNSSVTELFKDSIARANRELGQISSQLIAKNRKLSIQSQFFEAMSRFHAELRPDSSPRDVLEAIGRTATAGLDVPNAAVFSLPPDSEEAIGLIVRGNAAEALATAVDFADAVVRPPAPGAAGGPVLSAGDDIEWLINAISPHLPHDRRFWICLEIEGQCIGGVAWGAEQGESQRLGPRAQELTSLANAWSLALRNAQIQESSRILTEQLAQANRDLTTAQSQILRSRTLVTVGEMAAGAAHEMNNPLAVISGRSQLLATELPDAKQKASASLINEQAHRLSQIITEMMDFARPQPAVIRRVEIKDLIDCAVDEAKRLNDPADRLVEAIVGQVPPIAVDMKQATAALVEVIANAIQAVDAHAGAVRIACAFDAYTSNSVITVTDNGCGMDSATLKRAFDPFFSAKPAGRRRGMGLAKALRWIEASGGQIRLESRVGQGTRCVILFPASESAEEGVTESTPANAPKNKAV